MSSTNRNKEWAAANRQHAADVAELCEAHRLNNTLYLFKLAFAVNQNTIPAIVNLINEIDRLTASDMLEYDGTVVLFGIGVESESTYANLNIGQLVQLKVALTEAIAKELQDRISLSTKLKDLSEKHNNYVASLLG